MVRQKRRQVIHHADGADAGSAAAMGDGEGLVQVQVRHIGADFSGVDLSRACLVRAHFERTSLRGAILDQADLRGTTLRHCDLAEASLRGANLCGADLSEVSLMDTAIEGATYDSQTQWPQHFNPVCGGAIKLTPADADATDPAFQT